MEVSNQRHPPHLPGRFTAAKVCRYP